MKYIDLWRMSCEQLANHDELMASKEKEVEELKMRLSELEPGSRSAVHACTTPRVETLEPPKPGRTVTSLRTDATEFVSPAVSGMSVPTTATSRRGKAPPVDMFSGEASFKPALERAATWNAWSSEETLLQLAGHLQGRALEGLQ